MNKEKQIAEIGIELSNALHEHDIAWTNYIQDSENHPKPMGEFRAMAEHLYNAGYRKQSEGKLTKAHIEAHYEAICALADMVGQFGYSTTFRKQKAICDGGLSALEYAFGALQDCGCKINSNGSITLKNLWAFQEEFEAKKKGGDQL